MSVLVEDYILETAGHSLPHQSVGPSSSCQGHAKVKAKVKLRQGSSSGKVRWCFANAMPTSWLQNTGSSSTLQHTPTAPLQEALNGIQTNQAGGIL